jgi:hypothetical protein
MHGELNRGLRLFEEVVLCDDVNSWVGWALPPYSGMGPRQKLVPRRPARTPPNTIFLMDRPLAEAGSHSHDVRGEQYDLRTDPHEWNNLYGATSQARAREQMKTFLLVHLACAREAYPMALG